MHKFVLGKTEAYNKIWSRTENIKAVHIDDVFIIQSCRMTLKLQRQYVKKSSVRALTGMSRAFMASTIKHPSNDSQRP